jgi:PAS domain S-box-containing protein
MDHQNDDLFKAFLQKTHVGLVLKKEELSFSIYEAGDNYLKITGLNREALIGKDIFDVEKDLFPSNILEVLERVLMYKSEAEISPFLLTPTDRSKSIYISIHIFPVVDHQGGVEYLLYTVRDIDQEIRFANERANRNYFMELIEQAPVGMGILKGKELIIESANTRMLELWGKNKSVLNMPMAVALPELEGQPFLRLLQDVYTWGEAMVGNEAKAFILRNGKLETAYFNYAYQPIKDKKGHTTGIMMIATEVTPLVLVKQKLEESVSSFRSVVMNAHYSLLVLKGKDWIAEIANQRLLDLWNKKKEEVIGLPLLQILPELVGQPFLEYLKTVYETGEPYGQEEEVFYYNTANGIGKKYVSFFYDPMIDAEGRVYGVIVGAEDITARVESRHKVERAEEMLRIAIESANLGTWHYDPLSKRLTVSPRLKELFGYKSNEEMTYDTVITQVTEEYREVVQKAIQSSVIKGEHFDLEFSIKGHYDQQLRWMRATGRIYRDKEGLPVRFSGILLDITEHKQDEIRKNDFIAMVSHELKTPLTSLKAYVQLLSSKAKASGDIQATNSLSKADGQVNKMNNMIKSFLDLSRLEAGKINLEKQQFCLNELIAEVIEEITLTDRTHNISTGNSQEIMVFADREKIGQVINNLIGNAIKYSPQGKIVEVVCKEVNGETLVSVRDEGIGIPKDDIGLLFDRFYRVESRKFKTISGFGIGLYLSAEIIKRHDGQIWVESEEGKGSTFYFTLPHKDLIL